MKTPTIEEVKEFFKDAKEVEDKTNIAIIDIETIRYDKYARDIIVCNSDCRLSGITELYNSGGYSQIISYKSNPNIDLSKLTPELITELCKDENVKQILINNGVVKNELEVNRWYKVTYNDGKNINKSIYCVTNIYDKVFGAYGFDWAGNWAVDKYNFGSIGFERLATPQEVETALKNEAVKRGYKSGVTCLFGKAKDKRVITSNDFHYCMETNLLAIGGDVIFNNGVWSEIIPQEETYVKIPLSIITLTESKKKLGKIVKNLAKNV
jgi:hypothetical protein